MRLQNESGRLDAVKGRIEALDNIPSISTAFGILFGKRNHLTTFHRPMFTFLKKDNAGTAAAGLHGIVQDHAHFTRVEFQETPDGVSPHHDGEDFQEDGIKVRPRSFHHEADGLVGAEGVIAVGPD